MSSEYAIIKLGENDFQILVPLMQDCFGMDVNLKYFEWKFKNNPAGFVEGYYALHSSGEVAAYYGVIPQLYIVNGSQQIIYQSCDTMTHSNHRRKGLFQKLATHCFDSLKSEGKLFIIGFGGGQSTPGFIKFGWKELFKIRYYFYPKLFKSFQNLKYQGIEEICNYELIEHLTLLSNKNSKVHSNKSAVIYKWRVSNPLNQYVTIAAKGLTNSYNSYLTYYVKEDKIVLFDFYIGDVQTGKNIFRYLKSKLCSSHKGIITFVQENSQWTEAIKNYAFISNSTKIGPLQEIVPFIFYAADDVMENYMDSSNWQINPFDHDAL